MCTAVISTELQISTQSMTTHPTTYQLQLESYAHLTLIKLVETNICATNIIGRRNLKLTVLLYVTVLVSIIYKDCLHRISNL
jgi:hypothetical protein